ncbi:unnamed protein product [Umbelopsis vinacea]
MPKNKGKGGKNRRRGKNENENDKRELVFKEEGQEYAQVTKMLGNGRLEAQCFDGTKRLAHIRGNMRKKVWINQGDIILLHCESIKMRRPTSSKSTLQTKQETSRLMVNCLIPPRSMKLTLSVQRRMILTLTLILTR